MSAAGLWVTKIARVSRRCWGWNLASGCGREIKPGEKFTQSTLRCGLARAELCTECAAIAKVKGGAS